MEVLSNSTETTNKREKRVNYQSIETSEEYVLVSQNEVKVEVYRKDELGNWSLKILGIDDKVHLESVGLTMTMAEIYKDVIKI